MSIRYSLIVPIYKNAENIADLLAAIGRIHAAYPDMEAVLVVDGSPDRSWELLHAQLGEQPYPAQLIALSRNFGAFAAIRTGLEQARGAYMAVMAADLQEPPELVPQFFAALESGVCDIAVGQRTAREDALGVRLVSGLYWKLYRRLVNPDLPPGGVDIFGCNRQVAEAVLSLRENNSSLIGQIFWVGYRRLAIPYARRAREKGVSAWTMWKKLVYALDSVFSFSDLPILCLLWIGVGGVCLSLLLALVTLAAKLLGLITVPGYTMLLVVLLLAFSVLLLSQGIMGCYLWRCFENTKQRPLTLIRDIKTFPQAKSDSTDAPRA